VLTEADAPVALVVLVCALSAPTVLTEADTPVPLAVLA
jgi:hypothetical protein